jgi:hypothetical protein
MKEFSTLAFENEPGWCWHSTSRGGCGRRRRGTGLPCRSDAGVASYNPLLAIPRSEEDVRTLGRLREHRTEPAGLCDWLLWAYLVGEGVVLGKDGSLLAPAWTCGRY